MIAPLVIVIPILFIIQKTLTSPKPKKAKATTQLDNNQIDRQNRPGHQK